MTTSIQTFTSFFYRVSTNFELEEREVPLNVQGHCIKPILEAAATLRLVFHDFQCLNFIERQKPHFFQKACFEKLLEVKKSSFIKPLESDLELALIQLLALSILKIVGEDIKKISLDIKELKDPIQDSELEEGLMVILSASIAPIADLIRKENPEWSLAIERDYKGRLHRL